MPLPINHGNSLRQSFLKKQLSVVSNTDLDFTPKQIENIKKHITRYRRNWDKYATEVLGIKLYPLQKFSLHMMGVSQEYFEIATRGAAKSFRVALAAIVAFCLYPYSEIVITSSTVPQAARLVEKKMRDEIIKKLSPYLLYMLEHEYIVIVKSSTSDGGAYTVENKLNGSTITVAPCLESARGIRSTINIYEEARLLKKSIIDSVFEPMGHARQAKYLLNPKYNTKRWQEKARSFYITSARYNYEWFANKFRDTVTNYYTSKHEVYTPFAQDIFTAIDDGSRTWADYRKAKKSMSSLDFRMEILNEMFSENEHSYFSIQEFKRNQTLTECFRPPTSMEILSGASISMENKDPAEIRYIVADLAFAGTTTKEKNDRTIFECISLHWNKYRFERHVDYIEARPGGGADKVVLRLKELFWDFKADYVVIDIRSGGEAVYDYLSNVTEHPERGGVWNPCGFTVIDDPSLILINPAKIADLKQRTGDQNALPCIIPITATAELNSLAWQTLKKQLETNNYKFLISMQDEQAALEDTGEYYQLTSEEYAEKLAPYGQTDLMVQECVNLSAELKNGLVKLVEPRNGYKDKAVVLAYSNLLAEKLDNIYIHNFQEAEINMDNVQLVW